MVERYVTIKMPCGMHLRPAGILADAASGYKARGYILYKNSIINAKSMLNLVSQGISYQDEVLVRCVGPEEEELMERLVSILEDATMTA